VIFKKQKRKYISLFYCFGLFFWIFFKTRDYMPVFIGILAEPGKTLLENN
jgi:hypothetical protein